MSKNNTSKSETKKLSAFELMLLEKKILLWMQNVNAYKKQDYLNQQAMVEYNKKKESYNTLPFWKKWLTNQDSYEMNAYVAYRRKYTIVLPPAYLPYEIMEQAIENKLISPETALEYSEFLTFPD